MPARRCRSSPELALAAGVAAVAAACGQGIPAQTPFDAHIQRDAVTGPSARLQSKGRTVEDSVTGLQWMARAQDRVTLADAAEGCARETTSGFTDWRLPSRIELTSLIDFQRLPTIDTDAFPGTPADYFWTSSAVAGKAGFQWTIYFGQGLTGLARSDGAAHARCVRGTLKQAGQRFRWEQDLATDLATGLSWQRVASSTSLPWTYAQELCTLSQIAGLSGFRLPSINELATLIDETRSAPAYPPEVFPGVDTATLWAASHLIVGETSHHAMAADGTSLLLGPDAVASVRCVRSN